MAKGCGRAQRGYYAMPWVRASLAGRVAAIAQVVPPGSRVADIGCNDGTVGMELLKSGLAQEVYGYDLEDIRRPEARRDKRFKFEAIDLNRSLPRLSDVDVVLLLSVLHHLWPDGTPLRQAQLLELALKQAHTVICDMGSMTEPHTHSWKRRQRQFWSSDIAMAKDLFQEARYAYPIHCYPAQGGRRLMWKLGGHKKRDADYTVIAMYRRTVGRVGQWLYRVTSLQEAPVPWGRKAGRLCPFVVFYWLRDASTGEEFWAKRYGKRSYAELEYRVAQSVARAPHLALAPIAVHQDFGLVYPFYEQVRATAALNYSRRHLMEPRHREECERFAATRVNAAGVRRWPLGRICDFQAVATKYGLMFYDFAPNDEAIVQATKEAEAVNEVSPDARELAGAGSHAGRGI